MTHTFHVVVERDLETKVLVASVVELPGCYTQAHDLTELESNIREAIALYVESEEMFTFVLSEESNIELISL